MCFLEQMIVGAFIVDSNAHSGGCDAKVAAGEAGAGDSGGDLEGAREPALAGVISFFNKGAGGFLVVASAVLLLAGTVAVNQDSAINGNGAVSGLLGCYYRIWSSLSAVL
jgi:hypothetical protein